ncbi:MAG: 50S ribosomal protein L22 [Actinomycetota bacterium]|nr:50S ribosomal protein L22 [Actinomycetota bacterium]
MANGRTRPPGTFVARARFVHMSPFKVREVMDIIRGKPIDEARRILAFTPKTASRTISKVLESAVATAEHDYQVPQDELYVKGAWADEGMTIKRFRPRAQGRGYRIRKRTCHIHLELGRRVQVAPPPARPGRLRTARRPQGAEERVRNAAAASTRGGKSEPSAKAAPAKKGKS